MSDGREQMSDGREQKKRAVDLINKRALKSEYRISNPPEADKCRKKVFYLFYKKE